MDARFWEGLLAWYGPELEHGIRDALMGIRKPPKQKGRASYELGQKLAQKPDELPEYLRLVKA